MCKLNLKDAYFYIPLSEDSREDVTFCWQWDPSPYIFTKLFKSMSDLPLLNMCGVLRDLVLFVQFKKREKHPWRSINFLY